MRQENQGMEEVASSELIEPGQLRLPLQPRRRLATSLPAADLWAIALALLCLATVIVSLLAGLRNH